MASAAGQADDDFDFADDTAVTDEQADIDWDDLDEPDQPAATIATARSPAVASQPLAPSSTAAAMHPPAAAPPPVTQLQATPIVTKVGPIPFTEASPPDNQQRASAAPATLLPASQRAAIDAPPAHQHSPAGTPAVTTGSETKPGQTGQASAMPAVVPLGAGSPPPAAAAAGGGARPAAVTSPARGSTPPARQYANPPGGLPSAQSTPAGSSAPPVYHSPTAATAAHGPPPPSYAAIGRPAPTASPSQAPAAAASPDGSGATVHPVQQPATNTSSTVQQAQSVVAQSAAAVQPPAARLSPVAEVTAPAAGSSTAGASSGSSSKAGGAWGSWGFGGFTSKLQQVALGAAKDLQELTASVQQAVAEVVAAEDVAPVDRLSAYQERPSHPGPAPPAGTAAPPAPVTVSRGDSSPHLTGSVAAAGAQQSSNRASNVLAAAESGAASARKDVPAVAIDAEEAKRQEVLARLQGEDTQLESGLKAIDEQVDLLAASAAKALGSLWGGFSTVAKQTVTVGAALTAKVEAAAKEVAKELVVGLEEGANVIGAAPGAGSGAVSLREAAGQLAAKAERTLESVGRGAASLLDPQFARGGSSSSHQRTPSDWAATFDSCFELYGGTQAAEELEQLSSDCAHICNRARAELQQEAREQIDATLSKIAPAFDTTSVQQQQQQQQQQGQSAVNRSSDADEQDAHLQDAFEQLYLPVRALCSKGRYKASQLQQEASEAAPEAAAADAALAQSSSTQAEQDTTAVGSAGTEIQPVAELTQQQDAAGMSSIGDGHSSQAGQLDQLLQRLLSGLRSVAVKSLAEVSAGQLMLMLSLGRSLAALPRYGKPIDDGLDWPADPQAVAQLLQARVLAMLADVQQLAGVFSAAAPAVLQALQDAAAAHGQQALAHFSSELAAQQVKAAAAEVDADCSAALSHVRDGFGKLLYVVLLASVHKAGFQEQQAALKSKVDSSNEGSIDLAAGTTIAQ